MFNYTPGNSSGDVNLVFKEYFQNELDTMAQKFEEIDSMKVKFWYASDSCSFAIEYSGNISQEEQNNSLAIVKAELDSKWYVKEVFYSSYLYLHGPK